MGREITTTIIEQKGSVATAVDDLDNSTSNPIQQFAELETDKVGAVSTSRPVEQRDPLSTDEQPVDESTSNPVEQRAEISFNEGEDNPDDCFVEQIKPERLTTENPDTPIEQIVSVTSDLREGGLPQSRPVEQKIVERDAVGDEPLEQKADITNQIELTQYNFAESIFPPCGSIKNPVTTSILWRIKDSGVSFNSETIVFIVDGVEVQDTSEFTVTPIANGLQLDYDPPANFDYAAIVEIQLFISDNASPPNNFYYRCKWETVEDSRPPVIDLISPVCNSTGVDILAPVIVQIVDVGDGVDLDSISLSIEGITVCSGLSFESIATVSGNGYTMTWTHSEQPFRYDSNVTVAVEATDLSPLANSAFFVCGFDTEQSSVPEFVNFDPAPCETVVDNTTGLTFEIYGDVDGVDISALEVRIDNKLRTVYVRPRVLRSE